MPKTSIRDWFSTHMGFTDKTRLFDQLAPEERGSYLTRLAIQIPEEIILVSSFDDENFMLLTKERILLLYEGKIDETPISKILQFGREGGLGILMKESQSGIFGGLIRSFLLRTVAVVSIIYGLIYYGFWHWQYVQFPHVVNHLNQLSGQDKIAR